MKFCGVQRCAVPAEGAEIHMLLLRSMQTKHFDWCG